MALLHNLNCKGSVERKLFVALLSCNIEENYLSYTRLHRSLGVLSFAISVFWGTCQATGAQSLAVVAAKKKGKDVTELQIGVKVSILDS
jgi:hypothetical protein